MNNPRFNNPMGTIYQYQRWIAMLWFVWAMELVVIYYRRRWHLLGEFLGRISNVSHILFDKQFLSSLEPDALAIAQPSFTRWYAQEYEDKRYRLYRLQ